MKRKLRVITALLVGLLPFNNLRITAYRWLLGYSISYTSRIGWANLLVLRRLQLTNAHIGHFNRIEGEELVMNGAVVRNLNSFLHFHAIYLEQGADFDNRNNVYGTRPEAGSLMKQKEILRVGARTTVTSGHKFDLSDTISVGSDVTIGGYSSEFWTHGFDVYKRKKTGPVVIGDQVYIGSSCKILPGVSIASFISLSAGTIVPKPLDQVGLYFSSKLEYRPYRSDSGKSPK